MGNPPSGYKYDYSGNPMDPDLVPISDVNGTSIGSYGNSNTTIEKTSILDYDGTPESARKILEYARSIGDTATMDKIIEWWREDNQRREAYSREDTAYSRMGADLRNMGINPLALMQGANPISSNIGYGSSGTSQYTSARQLSETSRHNKTQETVSIISAIISAISTIAVIAALA